MLNLKKSPFRGNISIVTDCIETFLRKLLISGLNFQADHRSISQIAAKLNSFIKITSVLLTSFRVKILLNYQLQNEVRKAKLNTIKRFYNWPPSMKVVYVHVETAAIFSSQISSFRLQTLAYLSSCDLAPLNSPKQLTDLQTFGNTGSRLCCIKRKYN